MRTTAAIVHEQGQELVLEEVELDEPQADEVLVLMVASGLCHTDILLRDTLPAEMFPRVSGHEGAGVVEQVGDDVEGIGIEGDSDPQGMIPRLLDLRADGRIEVDHLLTTYPSTQVDQAVLDVLAGTVVKPVLVW